MTISEVSGKAATQEDKIINSIFSIPREYSYTYTLLYIYVSFVSAKA